MTLRNVLLTAHILVAMLTIGWLMVDAVVLPRAMRTGQGEVVRFAESVARKLGPAAGLVLLLGIALVLRDSSDGIEFSTKWVGMAMALFVVAMVNGAVFIGGAARRAADKIDAGQSAADEARKVSMLAGINAVLLVVIVYLMVARPT